MNRRELISRAREYLDYETPQSHTWCSGCGNYGILNALTRALVLEGHKPHEVMWANDVGCNGNVSDKIMTNTIHGLHGRVLPLAAGLSIATDMPVVAMAGDGSTLSEGINHYIHAIRNNFNITFILHNNKNYGLTIGQASSTTPKGNRMNGTPGETMIDVLNPLQLALATGCGYVARGYSSDADQLTDLIQQGLQYRGFALIEVLQLCPTFNHHTPEEWYLERVYDIKNVEGYDPSDIWAARKIVDDHMGEDKIATGVLHNRPRVDFYDSQKYRADYETTLPEEVRHYDVTKQIQAFV